MIDLSKNLVKIKELKWNDVFEIWRKNEDYHNSHWVSLWQERGFKSWEDWRMTYAERFELPKLNDWVIYDINNPLEFIPQICGGSFSSWLERYYNGENNPTFAQIAQHPDVQSHQGIIKFMEDFPAETIISGVILGNKIVVVEGMHRCVAIALAVLKGQKIETKMQICLANHYLDKLPVAGKNTKER